MNSLAVDNPTLPAVVEVPSPLLAPPSTLDRTVWGLDALELQARYWAAHGVQVVRQGEPSQIVRHAELFLLIDADSLALFKLGPVMDTLNWIEPRVLFLRLHDSRARRYREQVVTDSQERFLRFERIYSASARLERVALTPDYEVAQLWQGAANPLVGWRRLRRFTPRMDRTTVSIKGSLFDLTDPREVATYMGELMQVWKRPDSTISRAVAASGRTWKDPQATILPGAKCIGPVWIGAGRTIDASATVIGPAVVWDDPASRPPTEDISWQMIEPASPPLEPTVRSATAFDDAFKRAFDILFALFALAITLPLYPFIMLAIWLEDGGPFFFSHRRETRGGREFPCLKFRSMRKNAEQMKAQLKLQNQADGPQFYIENDPRLTRVGRKLRKYNLDELPQFFNVLVGDMSIVGPRASPFKENQFSPAWREARLSVRAGITGLWQVKRTRRAGSDFQEWIKYDIEYVEKRSLALDLLIIWKTISNILVKMIRS
jgi:lipopolysaccharide/colanic/teichoic acid biosynthesis glycosyltransferase